MLELGPAYQPIPDPLDGVVHDTLWRTTFSASIFPPSLDGFGPTFPLSHTPALPQFSLSTPDFASDSPISQPSTPSPPPPLQPLLPLRDELCFTCMQFFAGSELRAHLRPHRRGEKSCPTTRGDTSVHCSRPGEPGCSRSFKDERTRKRHRNKSCKMVPRDNCGSICRCGKYFSRFDGITKHQKHCDSPLGAAYECVDCDEAFADMGSLTEHHRANHVEKAGRPKLRRNREHCD